MQSPLTGPFSKDTCPYCGDTSAEAEWCDVGVGYVQSAPYHCEACGATEIGPYDKTSPTEQEKRTGWYAPNSKNLPDTISTLDGAFIDASLALSMYQRGMVPHVPFQLTTADLKINVCTLAPQG